MPNRDRQNKAAVNKTVIKNTGFEFINLSSNYPGLHGLSGRQKQPGQMKCHGKAHLSAVNCHGVKSCPRMGSDHFIPSFSWRKMVILRELKGIENLRMRLEEQSKQVISAAIAAATVQLLLAGSQRD